MALLDFFRGGTEQDRFAREVMSRLREAGWQGALDYDKDRFEIDTSGVTGRVYLGNMFRGWQEADGAAAREQEFAKIIGFLLETADGVPDTLPAESLMPVIRARLDFEPLSAGRTGLPANTYAGAAQPLCDVMTMLIASDSEHGIRLLGADALRDSGLDFATATAQALDNLRAASPCKFTPTEGGFYISDYQDHYDSSRVLLPHLFEQLGLKGDPVAIVFERRSILVAGADDAAALEHMGAAATQWLAEADRLISCLPIRLTDGVWAPFDAEAARQPALHALRGQQWGWVYGGQKELLDAEHEKDGTDIFVASLMLIEHEGWLRSVATWTTDALSLLPRADVVLIGSSAGGPSLARSWDSVEQVMGPLSPEPGLWPPRYRIDGPALLDVVERLRTEHRCPPWFFEMD
ncbi:hypothetical protein [Sphingomonas sanxanigenens]|uniref:Uncharacterized protein n=1 Tax=Sphingomonas sanxanigenens DSM 19645 = NX02 TaxID=1123269 RepID=W0AH20_9SPHN|nr:hypothetical protein [Sphingomonas sanxanigenens]AHE55842.1 hypothetical protein NX02_21005 [Sphingomonas sanxanigenens DSM 19645 = NX02]